jgi:hypothetical protein
MVCLLFLLHARPVDWLFVASDLDYFSVIVLFPDVQYLLYMTGVHYLCAGAKFQ